MAQIWAKFEKRKLVEISDFPNFEILGRFGSFRNYFGSFWLVSGRFGWFWFVLTDFASFRIQFEYRKIRTRKNSVSGHFSRSDTNE